MEPPMEPPPAGPRRNRFPAPIIRGGTTGREQGGAGRGGDTGVLTAALHQARALAQSLKRAQRCGALSRGRWRRARIVGRTHGERGVGPIRELDDQVWITALPDPDQQDPLAAPWVMWMGDEHRFRRRLGQWGSVL